MWKAHKHTHKGLQLHLLGLDACMKHMLWINWIYVKLFTMQQPRFFMHIRESMYAYTDL